MNELQIKTIKKSILKNKKIGKEIESYQEIESTHLYASKIAEKNQCDGKVIIAEKQTGGIGTKGKQWHTGAYKNIALTIILYPNKKANELEGLTTKIAECIKEAIEELFGYELKIKEPNDLMLNGKKICGILTQIHTRGEEVKNLIISFGFNVNEDIFLGDIKEIATSLKQEYKKEFDREKIIIAILRKLDNEIEL